MMCKWVIELVLFSGMLPVLAQIFIAIKPSAAVNSEKYAGVLLPDEITEGWHRAAVNHYTFERMQLIGHDHPDDQYLSLKLLWPKEISPYIRFGKITFFKCINRTPAVAKALMQSIRGGIGTPELALEIFYAPVQRALINALIISCDIYVGPGNPSEKEDNLFLNLFKVRVPDPVQTEKEISVLSTTAETTTPVVNLSSEISETTFRSQAKSEGTGLQFREPIERNNGERLFDSERSPGTSVREFYRETATQSTVTTIAYTESMTPKMNVETTMASFKINEGISRVDLSVSENEKPPRRISLSEETSQESGQPVLQSRNTNRTPGKGMKLETSPETNKTSFFDELTSETTDKTIENFEVTTSKMNLQTMPLSKTILETTTTSLGTHGDSLQKDSENSKNESMNKIDQSKESNEKSGESIQQSEKTETTNREKQATYSNQKLPESVTKPESKTSWNTEFTNEIKDTKTLYTETTTLKIDQTISLDNRSTLAANEISSQTNKLIMKAHCSCAENETGSNEKKTGAKSTESILDLKSAETSKASSQNSIDVVTPENRADKNTSGKESIENPVTSRWYNLAVNALPKGTKRKMGLAKITY